MDYKAILYFIKNNKNISYECPTKIKKKYLFINYENKYFNGFTHINDIVYKLELSKY